MPLLYLPLSVSSRMIRVLKLLPSSKEQGTVRSMTPLRQSYEEIACTLEEWPLDASAEVSPSSAWLSAHTPSYEALSYTWGTASESRCIRINQSFCARVRLNLYTALRALRQDYARVLWIDALCINQEDNVEKSQQVLMMHKIFATAREVIVWLVVLSPALENKITALQGIDPTLHFPSLSPLTVRLQELYDPYRSSQRPWLKYDVEVQRQLDSYLERYWCLLGSYLREMLQASYFERLWILQEIQSAKRICVRHGTLDFGWITLEELVDFAKFAHSKVMGPVLRDPACAKAIRLVHDIS